MRPVITIAGGGGCAPAPRQYYRGGPQRRRPAPQRFGCGPVMIDPRYNQGFGQGSVYQPRPYRPEIPPGMGMGDYMDMQRQRRGGR